MAEIDVLLPDGSSRSLSDGSNALDLAGSIGPRLAKDALAALVNGQLTDLTAPLANGATVAIVTPASDAGREVLRHSTAHVLAQAVTRMWPGAHYAIGPAIRDGFYYDFELPGGVRFSDDDLGAIESEMRRIIAEDQPFTRSEYSFDEGLALFADQPFKLEIINAVAAGGDQEDLAEVASASVVSTYSNGSAFRDLCRGPHVPSTSRLGHFKLMRVAGAYWRGDEKLPQLQRIYGTAWESEAALAAHLEQLAQAELRDHRRLGQELDLFSFPSEIGPGLAVFHPKGGTIRRVMEEYSRKRHEVSGYEFVYSPHITKAELFETSGHLDWFAEGMYPPMELDEGQQYYLKPMNCPFHLLIFKARQRSYRELPLRMFEFGSVYRYEKSGVVHGLTRVRGMTQDDAHIFCTREQMTGELASLLHFVLGLLRDFGLDEGGGAFYGPKISVQARDAIGRTWQMSTIQVDFQFPQRFDLHFIDDTGAEQQPIMIHRALFGSIERFFGILLEHYAGHFPLWLAPVQCAIVPVQDDSEEVMAAIRSLAAAMRDRGLRASIDERHGERMQARVRDAELKRIPYVVVIGRRDVERGDGVVRVRDVRRNTQDDVATGALIDRLAAEVSERRPE